jgi:hypothetical protein
MEHMDRYTAGENKISLDVAVNPVQENFLQHQPITGTQTSPGNAACIPDQQYNGTLDRHKHKIRLDHYFCSRCGSQLTTRREMH